MNDFADTNPDNFADTEFMGFDEIPEPNFSAPIDMHYEDDLWSDICRVWVIIHIFAVCYVIFG
jgi:hypothetical protein